MTNDFNQILNPCLENIGRDVEILLDANVAFDLEQVSYGRTSALNMFRGQTLQLATTVRSDEERSPVGFLMPEVAAIDMASTLLMTQGEVDQFNEEIAAAYNEVLNVVLNGWKLAAPSPGDRVVNTPDSRDVEAYTADGLEEFLDENKLELLATPFVFNGANYVLGIVGSASWFGLESVDTGSSDIGLHADESELGAFNVEAGAAAVRQPPERSDNGNDFDGAVRPSNTAPDAQMMLVDLSGALNAWLTENLQNGTLTFVRPSSNLSELNEKATLVLVGPRPELFRQLNIPQRVVAKPGTVTESESASAE